MRKKDYGEKYVCYQCGCKFYDLKKSKPLCPKCGVDQSQARQKGSSLALRQTTMSGSSRSRMRKKKDEDEWGETGDAMVLDDGGKGDVLEEGLSLVDDDDDFSGIDDDDPSEID